MVRFSPSPDPAGGPCCMLSGNRRDHRRRGTVSGLRIPRAAHKDCCPRYCGNRVSRSNYRKTTWILGQGRRSRQTVRGSGESKAEAMTATVVKALTKKSIQTAGLKGIRKSTTGILGLDEITGGGLPTGRPTLVCGGAGCGKTLIAMQFLVHGALKCAEPGVLMCFEETGEELTENVASLGIDLKALIAANLLLIDNVQIDRYEFAE